MIAALLGLALAQDGEPVDVRQALGSGIDINWTTLMLEVAATGQGGATLSSRAIEELARRDADAGVRQGVERIQVSRDRTVADLQEVPEFGAALSSRVSRWWAAETRYFSSGQIQVDARLSLVELLKPFTLATARDLPAEPGQQPRFTGLVIDARGTRLEPAWSPRVLSATGDVLYEGMVWDETAMDVAPVIYVSDPAHPASVRAGEDPLFLRADDASGTDLTLTPEDSQRFRTVLGHARLLGEGKVVVVLDPA